MVSLKGQTPQNMTHRHLGRDNWLTRVLVSGTCRHEGVRKRRRNGPCFRSTWGLGDLHNGGFCSQAQRAECNGFPESMTVSQSLNTASGDVLKSPGTCYGKSSTTFQEESQPWNHLCDLLLSLTSVIVLCPRTQHTWTE